MRLATLHGNGTSAQCQQVAAHLMAHGSITTLSAMLMDPPVCRLSERIRELEGAGWVMDRENETLPSGRHVTRYTVATGDGQLRMAL